MRGEPERLALVHAGRLLGIRYQNQMLHAFGAAKMSGVKSRHPFHGDLPTTQTPQTQAEGTPSTHGTPSGTGRCVQPVVAAQSSIVQALPSLQPSQPRPPHAEMSTGSVTANGARKEVGPHHTKPDASTSGT